MFGHFLLLSFSACILKSDARYFGGTAKQLLSALHGQAGALGGLGSSARVTPESLSSNKLTLCSIILKYFQTFEIHGKSPGLVLICITLFCFQPGEIRGHLC